MMKPEHSQSHLKLVTIHLPEAFLEDIDELVKSKVYPNRSEAIRIAVRDLLKSELWDSRPRQTTGTP